MKFSEKMCFNIILKVKKTQGFILSLEDTFFEKLQGGQIDPPDRFRIKTHTKVLKNLFHSIVL